MFIRAVTYEIKPGMMEEAEKVYHEVTRTTLKDTPGFERGYAMVNSKTGMAVTVAFWTSKEDFEDFNSTEAGRTMSERVEPLLSNASIVSEFDRLVQA